MLQFHHHGKDGEVELYSVSQYLLEHSRHVNETHAASHIGDIEFCPHCQEHHCKDCHEHNEKNCSFHQLSVVKHSNQQSLRNIAIPVIVLFYNTITNWWLKEENVDKSAITFGYRNLHYESPYLLSRQLRAPPVA